MSTSYTNRLGTSPEEGIKAPCVTSTSANITLSGEQTIGGLAVVAGNRVLVRSQTDNTENGIYVCAVGAWSRSTDFNAAEDVVSGVMVLDVDNEVIYKASFTGSYAPGTTALVFSDIFNNSVGALHQRFTTTSQQTVFTGINEYTVNVGAIFVSYQGSMLSEDDYSQDDPDGDGRSTQITLNSPVPAGKLLDVWVGSIPLAGEGVLASNVTYYPGGTGALARNLQSKLRVQVSVFDFMTEAQISDVQAGTAALSINAALQAAIDHVNSSYLAGTFGGAAGTVLCPAGVYRFSGFTIKKGVSLIGAGQGNTVFLLDTDTATGIKTPAKASQLAADAVSQSIFKGITFGIHSSLSPSGTTILLDTSGMTRCVFDDLAFVVPANVIGIENTGNTLAGSGGPAHWYNDWFHCFVDVSGGIGVRWGDNDSSTGEQVTAQTWHGGRIGGTSGTGLHIRGGTGNNFHGTTFEGLNGGSDDTIIMGDSSGTRVTTSNNFHGCYLEQVKITYNSNTNRNRRWGCYETTVAETDSGTRNGRVDNEQLYLGWSRNYVSGRVTTPTTVNKNHNIDSVTNVGTGIYDVNFDVTMPDTNYIAIAQAESSDAIPRISTKTTTSVRIVFENRAGTAVDPTSFVVTVQDNEA